MLVTKFYDANFQILVTDLITSVTRKFHHVQYFVINKKMVIVECLIYQQSPIGFEQGKRFQNVWFKFAPFDGIEQTCSRKHPLTT